MSSKLNSIYFDFLFHLSNTRSLKCIYIFPTVVHTHKDEDHADSVNMLCLSIYPAKICVFNTYDISMSALYNTYMYFACIVHKCLG